MLCINLRHDLAIHFANRDGTASLTTFRQGPPGEWRRVVIAGRTVGRVSVGRSGREGWLKVVVDAPGVAVWNDRSTPEQVAAAIRYSAGRRTA